MKVPGSMLVLVLFALCASAQTLSNLSARPEVAVIQKKWRIDVRNPALEKDPIKTMNERREEEQRRKETERQNEILIERGMPPAAPPVRAPAPETGTRGLSITYIYEVKIRNTGNKGIRILTWEYVFFEPGTQRVVGRRRFASKVNISPSKTSNVVVRSASSPTGTISATKAGKKSGDQYSEQVVIQSVEYADGSVWQAPSN